jgi:hypothetical protein
MAKLPSPGANVGVGSVVNVLDVGAARCVVVSHSSSSGHRLLAEASESWTHVVTFARAVTHQHDGDGSLKRTNHPQSSPRGRQPSEASAAHRTRVCQCADRLWTRGQVNRLMEQNIQMVQVWLQAVLARMCLRCLHDSAVAIRSGPGDGDAQENSLVAHHRGAVVLPVRVFSRDAAVVLNERLHRLR